MANYRPRVADDILEDKLDAMGCVLVEGPKYCGKTTLALQHARSVLYMADPDTRTANLIIAQTNISRLLQGAVPRLIDEWQLAPQFWDAVRNEVDRRNADGQFILTGIGRPGRYLGHLSHRNRQNVMATAQNNVIMGVGRVHRGCQPRESF